MDYYKLERKEYWKQYYQKNKKKLLQNQKKYQIKQKRLNPNYYKILYKKYEEKHKLYRLKHRKPRKYEGIEKWCSNCKKTEGDFVKHSKNKYGKQYWWCRECNRKWVNEYRKNNKEKILEIIKKYERKNLEKRKAWIIAAKIKKGEKCSICNVKINIVKHHPDYKKPLKIVYLCRIHHREIHNKLNTCKGN